MNNQKGFTLIDLIVASSVMMFLVSNSIYFAKQYRQNAMNALTVATVKSIGTICSGMMNDIDEVEKTARNRQNRFCAIRADSANRNLKTALAGCFSAAQISNTDNYHVPKDMVVGLYVGFDPFYQFDLMEIPGGLYSGQSGRAGTGKDLACGVLAFSPNGTKKYMWFEGREIYAEEMVGPPFWCSWFPAGFSVPGC